VIAAGLVVAWELAVRGGLINARLLPPPTAVIDALGNLLAEPKMARNISVTLAQALLAILIACPLGLLFGIALAENRRLAQVFDPFLYFAFSVPKSIFLPMFILAFGIGFGQKVMFGVFSAIFIAVLTTEAAVNGVPQHLVRAARAFGASRTQIYTRIYVPAMLPSLIEGLRLAMIFNITGVIFAEMYASREGLGHMIAFWGEYFMLPELLAGITIAAFLSIVVNEALRWMENRVGRWRE